MFKGWSRTKTFYLFVNSWYCNLFPLMWLLFWAFLTIKVLVRREELHLVVLALLSWLFFQFSICQWRSKRLYLWRNHRCYQSSSHRHHHCTKIIAFLFFIWCVTISIAPSISPNKTELFQGSFFWEDQFDYALPFPAPSYFRKN